MSTRFGQPPIRLCMSPGVWAISLLDVVAAIDDSARIGGAIRRGVVHSKKSSYTLKKKSEKSEKSEKSKDFFEDLTSVYLI